MPISSIKTKRPDEDVLTAIADKTLDDIETKVRKKIKKEIVPYLLKGEQPLMSSFVGEISIILREMWLSAFMNGVTGNNLSEMISEYEDDVDLVLFAENSSSDSSDNNPRRRRVLGNTLAQRSIRAEQIKQRKINREYTKVFKDDYFNTYLRNRLLHESSSLNESIREDLKDQIVVLSRSQDPANRNSIIENLAKKQPSKEAQVDNVLKGLGFSTNKIELNNSISRFFNNLDDSSIFKSRLEKLESLSSEVLSSIGIDPDDFINREKSFGNSEKWSGRIAANNNNASLAALERGRYGHLLRAYKQLIKAKTEANKRDKTEPFNKTRKIVQTELNAAYNLGRLTEYLVRGIDKVQWVTVTESPLNPISLNPITVCSHCQEQNGKVFAVVDLLSSTEITFDIKNPDFPRIPYHPYCRCYYIPVTSDKPITGSVVNSTNKSTEKKKNKKKTILSGDVLGKNRPEKFITAVSLVSIAVLYGRFGKQLSKSDSKLAKKLANKTKNKIVTNKVTRIAKEKLSLDNLEQITNIKIPEKIKELLPIQDDQREQLKDLEVEINNRAMELSANTASIFDSSIDIATRNQRAINENSELLSLINTTIVDVQSSFTDTAQFALLYDDLDILRKQIANNTASPDEIIKYKNKIDELYFGRMDASEKLRTAKEKYTSAQLKLRQALNETAGELGVDDDISARLAQLRAISNNEEDADVLFSVLSLRDLESALRTNVSNAKILDKVDEAIAKLNETEPLMVDLFSNSDSVIGTTLDVTPVLKQKQLVKRVDAVYNTLSKSPFDIKAFTNNINKVKRLEDRLANILDSKKGLDRLDYLALHKTLATIDSFLNQANRYPNLNQISSMQEHLAFLSNSNVVTESVEKALDRRHSKIKALSRFDLKYKQLMERKVAIEEAIENSPKITTFDRLGLDKKVLVSNLKKERRNLKRRSKQTTEVKQRIKQIDAELNKINKVDFKAGYILKHF